MSNKEKEDGVCESKLCFDLDSQCSISSNGLAQGIGLSMSNNNITDAISICANCGKGEEESVKLKSCTACKLVKYCSRDCQIAHRSQHKKECRKRAAELHDQKLFQQPQPPDDCPICFLRIPVLQTGAIYTGSIYYACCGKVICSGCCWAPLYDNQGNEVVNKKCPYCRTPELQSEKEIVKRYKKRVEAGDPLAIHDTGCWYKDGIYGYPQDYSKALELFHRAGGLGFAKSNTNIGYAYKHGNGVEVDENKAKHYYEVAAMQGEAQARHNLGLAEGRAGNMGRALKHFMIAVRDGKSDSLETIKEMYLNRLATKEDYTKALQSYQTYLSEIKSRQRDDAAAADEKFRYY